MPSSSLAGVADRINRYEQPRRAHENKPEQITERPRNLMPVVPPRSAQPAPGHISADQGPFRVAGVGFDPPWAEPTVLQTESLPSPKSR